MERWTVQYVKGAGTGAAGAAGGSGSGAADGSAGGGGSGGGGGSSGSRTYLDETSVYKRLVGGCDLLPRVAIPTCAGDVGGRRVLPPGHPRPAGSRVALLGITAERQNGKRKPFWGWVGGVSAGDVSTGLSAQCLLVRGSASFTGRSERGVLKACLCGRRSSSSAPCTATHACCRHTSCTVQARCAGSCGGGGGPVPHVSGCGLLALAISQQRAA